MPRKENVDSITIYRPGWMGNVLIGAIAAAISWGLYGPLASAIIFGADEAIKLNAMPDRFGLTVSSLMGAVLVGIGGARWLTSEVDTNILKITTSKAASAQAAPEASQQIALASPIQALNIAKNLK